MTRPAFVVVAVLVAETARIELGHGRRVLPQLVERLQRTADRNTAVVVEHATDDLKHAWPLGSNWLQLRYSSYVAGV